MMTSDEIRKQFLDFFAAKKHTVVPSASIVVKNDPTLLFTNAGMNQFKDYFLGNKHPANTRVTDTQKCLRVSGKHNDLEEVGVDTYHHTMFEMLGNWSFGDYFKTEAIAWAWELLTKIYNLDKDRLYVTIFEGDVKEGLEKDNEALNEWKKWIAEDRILLGNKKDNFWEMGDTGPCGPCTEIHFDCRVADERKKTDGKALVNNDDPQVIEIWNLVFIQFNRLKNGNLEPLPARHVDTGMGFERLVRAIQNKKSNYDTDLFTGTIAAAESITGEKYDFGDDKKAVAFRVIADHIRAIAFTIADGQLPSNTGAGYVIRRILRRAVRYYYSYLNYHQPLIHQLLPVLAKQFENVFPELQHQLDFVSRVVKDEEEAFLRTLEKGLKKIDEIVRTTNATKSSIINGKAAFELFDTYGFPIDLTRLIAAENELAVNEQEFEAEMKQQKDRSRAATALDTEDWVVLDDYSLSEFLGYDSLEVKSKVVKYRKVTAKGKESYQLVLEATPFYAESGGQTGDKGSLFFTGEEVQVYDTKKENNLIVHFTDKLPAAINTEVLARVDRNLRLNIQAHHTATHLLHAALRSVLGNHVAQKGSLVNSEHLRFDFSHFSKVTAEEIEKIEAIVNENIRANIPVIIKEMKKEDALALGAMALFGEKYSDIVRVVIIDPEFSVELCGGTHVITTGHLGFFKIKHETAVAAGVRRIEAVAGVMAQNFVSDNFNQMHQIKAALKNPKDLQKAIENLQSDNSQLKKKLESLEARQLVITKDALLLKVEKLGDIDFIGQTIEVNNADSLRKLCTDLKPHLKNFVVVLVANIDRLASVAVMLDEALAAAKKLDAAGIIKQQVAPLIKGGGGGQKLLATAGGQDASNLNKVIELVKNLFL